MRYRSPGIQPTLSRRALDYLEKGAAEGSRNGALFDAACQFRDAGIGMAEAEPRLITRAVADGLSESEARSTIRSAFAQAARGPATGVPSSSQGGRDSVRPGSAPIRQTTPEPISLPEPLADGFLKLLETCFLPEEYIALSPATENEDGDIVPKRGVTLTAAEWADKVRKKGGIDRCFTTPLGLFVRINPMKKDGAGNADVASHRHVLVEFDRNAKGEPIPKEVQYGAILASGLPVSAVIDSGNKSLHAWIRVEAADAAEYQNRVETIWNWFEGLYLDKQNKNPSRLSRCPEGWRTVHGEKRQQKLLALNIGAESWTEWQALNPNDGLPEIEMGAAFMSAEIPEPPQLIGGVLHQKAKMALGGSSKGRKSWTLIDMMLSVATGTPWWGFPTALGRVLYLNFELPKFAIQHRIAVIAAAKGITDFSNFDLWNLRGYAADFSVLIPKILQRIRERHYGLIVLDPIYKGLGARDENKTGDIASLCNEIERLAEQSGAAAVFGAHYSKGNQSGKDALDRISGSGVFARDPDVILTMTPHEENEAYVVDLNLRALPQMAPFVVRWRGVLFERDMAADAACIRKPGKAAKAPAMEARSAYRRGSIAERYRPHLERMEPLAHQAPDEASPVLKHIIQTIRAAGESCDIAKARRIFDGLRHHSCGLFIFRNKCWQGCAYAPNGGAS